MARADLEEWADGYMGAVLGLSKRQTFGCPSWYAGKRLFAFIYEDALVVKTLPETVEQKIRQDSFVYGHFNPGDGIMKNWLTITRPESGEYEQDKPAIEAWLMRMV